MENIERYSTALNNNINTLAHLYKQYDRQKIKSFIYEEVDKFNLLPPYEALVKAYKYSVELIKNELN